MNVSDFKQLLQNPNSTLSLSQTQELESLLESYPYFQAARALHLKGLKNLESYKYNAALKVAAAHTTDREILFDYITSNEFEQTHIANSLTGKETQLAEKETIAEEVAPNPNTTTIFGQTGEQPLPQNISDAEQILDPALFNNKTAEEAPKTPKTTAAAQLDLGKPLNFDKNEKHSFSQWLQLTQHKPIKRAPKAAEEPLDKKKKFALLDKFIASNPKIVPQQNTETKVNIKDSAKMDHAELATETLAKVYLEQKKYKKAIQAYKILSLKYPEKSGFFADRIKAVKKLQKEKD